MESEIVTACGGPSLIKIQRDSATTPTQSLANMEPEEEKFSSGFPFPPNPLLTCEQFVGGFCDVRVLGIVCPFNSLRWPSPLLPSLLGGVRGGLLERFKDCVIPKREMSNEERLARTRALSCERAKRWARNHPERANARSARYHARHRTQIAERKRRNRNQVKESQWHKIYRTTEKGKLVRANSDHKRRIQKTTGCVTTLELAEIKSQSRGKCFYCREKRKLGFDHVIPISKGGTHTKDNIVCACGSCNSRKSSALPHQFANRIGRLLI